MIRIDIEKALISIEKNGHEEHLPFDSPRAFQLMSELWLRAGWDNKYVYSFSWLGRPIIQLPEDLLRVQEVIYSVKPNVIIETGIAHGGSLIFYAGLLQNIGVSSPRVLGVDIEIRKHNREAIESHELFPYISLIEASSTSDTAITALKSQLRPDDVILVMLDSNHTKEHVAQELTLYSEFVTKGSYIIAADGIMKSLVGAPRSQPSWAEDNPYAAIQEFVQDNPNFQIEEPPFPFNESNIDFRVTYWPSAYVKKIV